MKKDPLVSLQFLPPNHFFFSTFEFETAVAISVAVITAAVVVVIAVDVVAKVDI